jgi:hypothetical protein
MENGHVCPASIASRADVERVRKRHSSVMALTQSAQHPSRARQTSGERDGLIASSDVASHLDRARVNDFRYTNV